MESTSLDQAVESLLSPAPEDTGGDNLSEAVEQITEPEDDDHGEEIEAVAESDDDAEEEASSEQDDEEYDLEDVEVDDEDPVEATEDTKLITIKVDGKEEHWTLDQLKQSAAGQAAINKRFQEAAEARKQLEQQAAALQQQQAQFVKVQQQTAKNGQAPIPPSRELFESDPIGYMEEKLKYDEAKAEYDQYTHQMEGLRRQLMQAQQVTDSEYLQEQAKILQEYIPEITDPQKGQQIKDALVDIGVFYGYSAEEMQSVTDARAVRALNDARKYRELVAKKKSVQTKSKKARPVVKAGAKKRQDGNDANRKKAQQRLQKTGSIDDALNLIIGDS